MAEHMAMLSFAYEEAPSYETYCGQSIPVIDGSNLPIAFCPLNAYKLVPGGVWGMF